MPMNYSVSGNKAQRNKLRGPLLFLLELSFLLVPYLPSQEFADL